MDNSFRDCHNDYFHSFKYECIYDNKLTNITDNEIKKLKISGKSINWYEVKKN